MGSFCPRMRVQVASDGADAREDEAARVFARDGVYGGAVYVAALCGVDPERPSMGLPVPSKTRPRISPERAMVMGFPMKRVQAFCISMPLVPSKRPR